MRTKNNNYFLILERFINDFKAKNASSPSVREIADSTGISKSTVSRYLNDMRQSGALTFTGHRNIIMKKTSKETAALREKDFFTVPVLGEVACGLHKFAAENIEDYIKFPKSLLNKNNAGGGEFYLLHASGDSMLEAGINDGDLVLIKKQDYAERGDIVVALIDDEATLKRFYPEKKRIRLQPANKSMSPIYVKSCLIQGIAVKVLKDLE